MKISPLYVLVGVVTMVAVVYLYVTYKTLESFASKPLTKAQTDRAIKQAEQKVQISTKAIESLTKALERLATRKVEIDAKLLQSISRTEKQKLIQNKKDIHNLETRYKSQKTKAETDLAKAQADLTTLRPAVEFPRLTVEFKADGKTETLQKAVADYKAALQRLPEGFQAKKDPGPPPPPLVESEVVARQQALFLTNFNIYLEGKAAFDLADSLAKTPAQKAAVAADRQKWADGLKISLPIIKSYFCGTLNAAGETRYGRVTAAGKWPAGIPNPCTTS